MKYSTATIAIIGLALLCGACKGSDDDGSESKPTAIPLEGSIDPKLVGTWTSQVSNSTYTFSDKGTYHMESKVKGRQGAMEMKVDGRWRLNKDRVLLEDTSKNVVPYSFKLEGNKLTLALTGSLKNEIVLTKK